MKIFCPDCETSVEHTDLYFAEGRAKKKWKDKIALMEAMYTAKAFIHTVHEVTGVIKTFMETR